MICSCSHFNIRLRLWLTEQSSIENLNQEAVTKMFLKYLIFCVLYNALQEVQSATIKHEGVSKADIRDFPYMVAILDDDLDEFLGLGVLVSKNIVFCEEIL